MRVATGLVLVLGVTAEVAAHTAVIRVPHDAPTIQEAVARANDGDTIEVAPGRYCGATIDREVHLVATWTTTIVGCAEPTVSGLRAGFFLPDERASGTTIHGFRFDGRGISDDNLEPLAFAIFARDAHGVIADRNLIEGTVQGITNTRGDGWIIAANVIRNLTLLACSTRCGGGDGIVLQQRNVDEDRAAGNVVTLNVVTGRVPDGHTLFDMVGILVIGQERPVISLNELAIPDNPRAAARGIGVQVSDVCCGLPDAFPTTRRAVIVGNDGRRSQRAVVVDRDASGGTGNSRGAFIACNLGVVIIDGVRRLAELVGATTAAMPTTPYAMPFL